VAHSSKNEHCNDDWSQHSHRDDEGEFIEEREGSSEQECTTSESSEASTEDTDSHLSVWLFHLIISTDMIGMNICMREMNDIVDWETDQYNDTDGFENSELHIPPVHASDHTDDDNDDREDRDHTLEHISGGNQKDDKGEADWGNDSVSGIVNKGLFSWHPWPDPISLSECLQTCWCRFLPLGDVTLEIVECWFFNWKCWISTIDFAQEHEFEEDNFTSDPADFSACNSLVSISSLKEFLEHGVEVFLRNWECINLFILCIQDGWSCSYDPSFKLIDPAFLTFS